MAKKKAKKNQKVVGWATPPPSPKPDAEALAPALPEPPLELSEPTATEPTPDDAAEPIAEPVESKVEDPVVEVEPASGDSIAEDVVKQEEEAQAPIEDNESTPVPEPLEVELSTPPAEEPNAEKDPPADSASKDESDATIEPPAPSEPAPLEAEQTETTDDPIEPSEAVEVEEPEQAASEPAEAAEEPIAVPDAAPEPEPAEVVEAAPEPEPVEAVEEVPEPEPVEAVEEAPEPEPAEVVEEAPEPEPAEVVEEAPEPEPVEVVEEAPEPEPVEVVEEAPEPEPVEPVQEAEEALEPEPEPVQATEEALEPEPEPEPVPAEEVPEPQAEPVQEAEEPEPQAEPVQEAEESVPEPELRPDSPATIRAPSPLENEAQPPPTEPESDSTPVPADAIYAPSPKRDQCHPALTTPEEQSSPSPPPAPERKERPSESYPPKPLAARVIEDDRPPAPTPPVGRVRPRHSIAFDSDDDDDLALIQPRLRGDPSRVATYPPQSSHPRSLFASRVPAEHYSPPPPQAPPPGYHPRYYPQAAPQYPPAAPQYHHNHAYSMSQNGGYSNPSQNGGYPNPGQNGGYPNSSPYGPPSHGSSPYQESWGHFPTSYPSYGSPQRQDSIGSREYPLGPPSLENGSSAVDDDAGEVFSRISQAIPDLHVLLAKYKETHGQLGVREDLLRRAGIEQQERLKNKDEEIQHLKDRLSQMEAKHSSDASKLRLEIGNMEEQMKELGEQIAETERFKKEAEETRLALDAAKASWQARCKELEDANAILEKTALEEKAMAQKQFDDWRSTANTRHDAEKIALAIQFDKKLKEADVMADKQRQEAAANYVKEKDELRSDHQRQQRERESNYDRVRRELEKKLGAVQKDREEALIHERESREIWEAERETLAKAYEEDRESLQRGWDEQRELLVGQYGKTKEESDKAWIELHADANRKAEEEKMRADVLTKEKEELQRKYNELMAESQREKEVIKSVAGNLESEKARLEKLMECYGDIAEIKSKGDTYYSVSFSQLQRQIMDLATTHFVHLPVSPPPDDLANIPSGIPSFLGDTMASRQLRSAYVAHTVAKMITYRVFGPFLFSLGRRYDKADSLFSSMSNHIRDKSTRKEAIWRQQTLLAAFTSSGAKQRINTAAGTVVDEIIVAIKNFADPKEEEGIRIAVKRIVKLAAETWRFARLEREMITATMPALQDEEHKFTGPEFWPAYRQEGTPSPSLGGAVEPSDEQPKLLLRLFPVIYREPKHENFRSADETADVGSVYHHGLALYDDAEPVVTRYEELSHAGLPPVFNQSPTAADFPPPMIPPPRNPLPPAPEVSDSASVKSETQNALEISDRASTRSATSRSTLPPMSDLSIPPYRRRLEKVATPPSPTPTATPSETSRTSLPPMTDLSIPPYRRRLEKPEIKSAMKAVAPPSPTSTLPPATLSEVKRSAAPTMSDLSIPPYRPRSEKASVRSASPPPPSPPPAQLDPPDSPALTMYELSSRPYTRPIPVPMDFSLSEEAPLPAPTEASHTSGNPPLPAPTESVHPSARASNTPSEVPLPAPTDSVITSSRPRPPIPDTSNISHMSDESAIVPPLFSRRTSTITTTTDADHTSSANSRAASPMSPLFAAMDEIDALATHRSRNPSAASSRRATPTHTSNEELKKERVDTLRRTSGYAASNRSSMEGSLRSERTDRSGLSSNSRYMCESRSAAIKGLYPNSPMAGTPVISRTNSLRSARKSIGDSKSVGENTGTGTGTGTGTHGTWDTSSVHEGEPSTNA